MFTCPHCMYALTGKASVRSEHGSSEVTVQCNHCEAILRIQVTTLKDPNPKKLEKVNANKPANTYCLDCHAAIALGDESKHKCATVSENG